MWCKKTINFSGKTRDLLRCLKKYNRQETFFTSSNGHSLIKKASHSCYYVDHYIYHVTWRPFWNGSILRVFCVCYQLSALALSLPKSIHYRSKSDLLSSFYITYPTLPPSSHVSVETTIDTHLNIEMYAFRFPPSIIMCLLLGLRHRTVILNVVIYIHITE